MKRFVFRRPFALVLAAVVGLVAVAAPVRAVERPYASRGSAQFTADGFVGAGSATQLGLYAESGTIQLTPTGNPTVFNANATATYTAANGDQLRAVFTGQLDFASGAIVAQVTYAGGTGRFAGATGTAVLVGQLAPGGTSLEVVVKGTIDY